MKNNMKEKELAKKIGVTEVSVSRYINGIRTPSVNVAIKIARAFNCSVEDLFIIENERNIRPEAIEQYKKYQKEFENLLNKMKDLKLTKDEIKELNLKYYAMYV